MVFVWWQLTLSLLSASCLIHLPFVVVAPPAASTPNCSLFLSLSLSFLFSSFSGRKTIKLISFAPFKILRTNEWTRLLLLSLSLCLSSPLELYFILEFFLKLSAFASIELNLLLLLSQVWRFSSLKLYPKPREKERERDKAASAIHLFRSSSLAYNN